MGYTSIEPPEVYVASSWRNNLQPEVVTNLRAAGYRVYDFKDPMNDRGAFRWSDLGIERPEDWPPERCIEFLSHPRAEEGFRQDFDAMSRCTACVLVLPAGRSANLEAGWFVGAGRHLVVLKDHGNPDLMYKMATAVVPDVGSIVPALRTAGVRVPGTIPCRRCGRLDRDHRLGWECPTPEFRGHMFLPSRGVA